MEEEKSKLESEIKNEESKSFIAKAAKLGFLGVAGLAATAFSMATVGISGPIIAAAVGGGLMAGTLARGKGSFGKALENGLKGYAAINAIIYPMGWIGNVTYPLIGSLGSSIAGGIGSVVAKSAYALTAYNASFVTAFGAANHLLDNYLNPAGITEAIGKDFMANVQRVAVGFGPGLLLTANGITDIMLGGYKIPVFAINALPYAFYTGIYPLEENKAYKKPAQRAVPHGMPQIAPA